MYSNIYSFSIWARTICIFIMYYIFIYSKMFIIWSIVMYFPSNFEMLPLRHPVIHHHNHNVLNVTKTSMWRKRNCIILNTKVHSGKQFKEEMLNGRAPAPDFPIIIKSSKKILVLSPSYLGFENLVVGGRNMLITSYYIYKFEHLNWE